jgi:ribosomal protein S25
VKEEWKPIKGFEDYEVSSFGRVRSRKNGGCVNLKERITHDGYVWFNLCMNGKQHTKRLNRLVAEAFIENPECKATVNHIDGDKRNNRADNLEWATKEEQMKHAYAHGLKKPMRGVLQTVARFDENTVRKIRDDYMPHSKTFGMKALARKYGVSESCIDRIVRNQTYQNVG